MGSMFSLVLKPHNHVTEKHLEKLQSRDYYKVLAECAERGVAALQAGTPKRTGLTAASWAYEIESGSDVTTICWTNSNVTRDGDPIAILLQYGHGTGTGGYVAGLDYINPSIRPVFDEIADAVWKAVMQE